MEEHINASDLVCDEPFDWEDDDLFNQFLIESSITLTGKKSTARRRYDLLMDERRLKKLLDDVLK